MNLTLVQWVLAAFSLFAVVRVALQFRARRIPLAWAFVWGCGWVLLGVVSILPKTTDVLAASVGVGRGADLLVYVAIVALLYSQFRLTIKLEDVQHEVTMLVRAIGLKAWEDERKR